MSNEQDRDMSMETQPSTSTKSHRSYNNECITQVEPIILTQRWTVNNFATMMKLSRPGACLRSNIFRDQVSSESCWQLCLYPGGKREENANHVSLFLKMSATSPMKEVLVKAEYRFYFLDDGETPRFSNINIGDFHAKPPKGGHSWGLRNIPKQKVQNCIRTDGSLVISCVIELMPDVSRVQCRRLSTSIITPLVEISRSHCDQELEMFVTGRGTDIMVEAGDEIFHVHKYKLLAHSPVFNAMFTHENTREAKEKKVRIEDACANAVRTMIEYMYTGKLTDKVGTDEAYEVIQLAERYHINDLKAHCEQMLINNTDKTNVAEHAHLADYHQAGFLLDHCVQVMTLNRQAVLASDGWTQLKNANPKLAAHILEKMMLNSDQSPPPLKRSRI